MRYTLFTDHGETPRQKSHTSSLLVPGTHLVVQETVQCLDGTLGWWKQTEIAVLPHSLRNGWLPRILRLKRRRQYRNARYRRPASW